MPKKTKSRSSSRHLVKELNKIASAKARYKHKMIRMYEESFIQQVIRTDGEWGAKYKTLMNSCYRVCKAKFEEYDQLKQQLENGHGITRTYTSSRVRPVFNERQESETDSDSSSADLSD